MSPREAAILSAAATLLSTKQDVAYGPAHAVRDALALEREIADQLGALSRNAFPSLADREAAADAYRKLGAL